MTPKRFSHLLLVLALLLATTLAPLERAALAQTRAQGGATQTAAATDPDLQSRLAAIEKVIEEKRKEYHIPGVSFVIVKDDKVIYMKGLGLKDVERNLPVTPDTLFAIGSSTKAFTGMAAAMSADDRVLSLDDSPKKFLPYFKLRDPEADARITIRDLLSHRSGLDRTDLSMVSGKLNREELIRVAGMAKPTARLGEKFLYQNIMFAAAGEVVARAQKTTWDAFIEKRIFKPLGMRATNTTVAATSKSQDYAFGYSYNTETKETTKLPMRELAPAAPAGAINSNARDMAQWLRLMLGEGVFEGKRLVSEKNFRELVSPQHKIAGNVHYGLGWFLREWNGHKVVEHGGNIDGFNALVAMMPDQKLGFVMLTNISDSQLGTNAMEAVWSNLVGKPEPSGVASTEASVDPSREVGKYLLTEASVTFTVEMKDGKLWVSVPGQPEYQLESVGGRRYKLANAPEGFFVTFRPVKDKAAETEIYLEQPQGNFTLSRIKEETAGQMSATSVAVTSSYSGPLKDLLGSYEMKGGPTVEIKLNDGKVSMVVPGQPAYPLIEREKDKLYSPDLPDAYSLLVKRDAGGKVTGLLMKQPEGDFELSRVAETAANISADELIAKVIAAMGGEENLRRHNSMVLTTEMDFEHQGIMGRATISARAPNSEATHIELSALGKNLGTIDEYFDGTEGGEVTSFSPGETKAGKSLEDARINSDFYDVLNWRKLFKSIEVRRVSKVGDEDAYVVVKTPEKGSPVTDYISTKTFLLLRRDTIQTSNTSEISFTIKETYSDYRTVEGWMIPFRVKTNIPTIGDVVTLVKTVRFDVQIPDAVFHVPEMKK
ncbi:MAG TPA: serine hydrolase [Pyrinomonadaceae bacterium]|nr:serine hydrolase [Pyrinomonadaceae bacterium]